MKTQSCHPRVDKGGEKKNTCAPKSKARLLKAKAGIERHIEANPADAAARNRLSTLLHRIG